METVIMISGGIALALATVLGLVWIGEAINHVVHDMCDYEDE